MVLDLLPVPPHPNPHLPNAVLHLAIAALGDKDHDHVHDLPAMNLNDHTTARKAATATITTQAIVDDLADTTAVGQRLAQTATDSAHLPHPLLI